MTTEIATWADARELAFNTEIHHLLDAASDAIDRDGALESINATLPIIEQIRAKLIEERDRRTASNVVALRPNQQTDETAATVRAFLASVRPLEGVCYCSDARFHAGRAAIERLALHFEDEADAPSLADCSNMLHFLSNTQPSSEDVYAHAGHHAVLEHIRDAIAEHAREP